VKPIAYKWIALSNTTIGMLMATVKGPRASRRGGLNGRKDSSELRIVRTIRGLA